MAQHNSEKQTPMVSGIKANSGDFSPSFAEIGFPNATFGQPSWEQDRLSHSKANNRILRMGIGNFQFDGLSILNDVLQAPDNITDEKNAQKKYEKWMKALDKSDKFINVTAKWPASPPLEKVMKGLGFDARNNPRMVVKLEEDSTGSMLVWNNRTNNWQLYQMIPDTKLHKQAHDCAMQITAGKATLGSKVGFVPGNRKTYAETIAAARKQLQDNDPIKLLVPFGLSISTPVSSTEYKDGQISTAALSAGILGIRSINGVLDKVRDTVELPKGIQFSTVSVKNGATAASKKAEVKKYGRGYIEMPYLRRIAKLQNEAKKQAEEVMRKRRAVAFEMQVRDLDIAQDAVGRKDAIEGTIDLNQLPVLVPPARRGDLRNTVLIRVNIFDASRQMVSTGLCNPSTGEFVLFVNDSTRANSQKLFNPTMYPRNTFEVRDMNVVPGVDPENIAIALVLDKQVNNSTKYTAVAYYHLP